MPYVLKFGMSKPKDTNDEEKHNSYLTKTIQFKNPLPDNKHFIVKALRSTPISPVAQNGITDPRGLSEEARKWLRTSQAISEADSGFFNSKAPSKIKRLFNDASISDSWFAADAPIPMTKILNQTLQ